MTATPLYEAEATLLVMPGHGGQIETPADRLLQLNGQTRVLNTKLSMVDSEHVIRKTLDDVGIEAVYPGIKSTDSGANLSLSRMLLGGLKSALGRLPEAYRPSEFADRPGLEAADAAFIVARRALRVDGNRNTDLMRIVFRHPDREMAATFVNRIATNFIQWDLELRNMQGATTFLRDQLDETLAATKEASAALNEFAKSNQVYLVDEQRKLTLRRYSEVSTALATTRSALADKEGQAKAIAMQLSLMKPVAEYPLVASLPGAKPRDALQLAPSPAPLSGNAVGTDILARDPPLLLVRVYQDTILSLVKANTELAGIKATEVSQIEDLDKIEGELTKLSGRENEFLRRQADVALLREKSEAYARRLSAQQIEAEMAARSLSNIVVAQPATRPIQAISPNVRIALLAGGGLGLVLGFAAVLLPAVLIGRSEIPVSPVLQPPHLGNSLLPLSAADERSALRELSTIPGGGVDDDRELAEPPRPWRLSAAQ